MSFEYIVIWYIEKGITVIETGLNNSMNESFCIIGTNEQTELDNLS